MKSDCRISVLIPCNSTKYLSESIASIKKQTLGKNHFEVVIVVDRVDQVEVAEIMEGSSLYYKIITSDSPGIVAALNTGIRGISSEYVARMDEDDLMYPSRLQAQLEYLEVVSKCVAVGGQLELIDENGLRIGDSRFREHLGSSYKKLFTASPVAHPAAMIRRSAIIQVGGYRAFLAEDWDLWVRLREIGEVHNLSQKVIKYRVHNNQLSRQKMYAQSRARLIVGVSHFARKVNYTDEPVVPSELESWLTEAVIYLQNYSYEFRLFLQWAKRRALYEERLTLLTATKKGSKLFSIWMHHPVWFVKDFCKKFFDNR